MYCECWLLYLQVTRQFKRITFSGYHCRETVSQFTQLDNTTQMTAFRLCLQKSKAIRVSITRGIEGAVAACKMLARCYKLQKKTAPSQSRHFPIMPKPGLVWKQLNWVYFVVGSVPVCYFCKHWSLKLTLASLIAEFGVINTPETRCILYYLSLLFDFVYLFISLFCLNY